MARHNPAHLIGGQFLALPALRPQISRTIVVTTGAGCVESQASPPRMASQKRRALAGPFYRGQRRNTFRHNRAFAAWAPAPTPVIIRRRALVGQAWTPGRSPRSRTGGLRRRVPRDCSACVAGGVDPARALGPTYWDNRDHPGTSNLFASCSSVTFRVLVRSGPCRPRHRRRLLRLLRCRKRGQLDVLRAMVASRSFGELQSGERSVSSLQIAHERRELVFRVATGLILVS